MAQLTYDCFAFGGKMLSLTQAQEQLREQADVRDREEEIGLESLSELLLSRAITAKLNVPPFKNSAVDGYAYAHGQGPDLAISGLIAAGDSAADPLAPQTAVRILTGAPLPPGADTIIMDEDADVADNQVRIRPDLKQGSNVRPQGEDIQKGIELYSAGTKLSGLDVARLAAGGVVSAWVHKPLRIHVLSTGDEISSGQVVDVNQWILRAVFAGPAFDVTYGGIVPDTLDASMTALQGIEADLILTSGGVSVGDRDHMRDAIEALGELAFWRVGIKPGRPVAFGQIGETPIFGLPGNPVAAFVTAQFLALPYALAMLGCQMPSPLIQAPFAVPYKKKVARTEFVRVHIQDNGSLIPYAVAGAGVISSLTATDALAVLSDDLSHVEPGTWVPILPLKGLLT